MIGTAPRSSITGVPGWESAAEEERLIFIAALVPQNGLILEVGSEQGMSSAALLHGSDETVRLYCVDLFPQNGKKIHEHNLRSGGFDFDKRVVQIQGDSSAIGQRWNKPLDLLFLDGDHHYPGVTADIAAWIPHVKVGGWALFHDATPPTNARPHEQHHEVQKAIEEWLAGGAKDNWQELPPVDTMRVFRRVK